MASVVLGYDGECVLPVSNNRLANLVECALEVASDRPAGAAQWAALRAWWDDDASNGTNFELARRFPSLEDAQFWSTVFFDVGRRIFLRKLGNQEASFWQASAITDAVVIARALERRVQSFDPEWHAPTEDRREAADLYGAP